MRFSFEIFNPEEVTMFARNVHKLASLLEFCAIAAVTLGVFSLATSAFADDPIGGSPNGPLRVCWGCLSDGGVHYCPHAWSTTCALDCVGDPETDPTYRLCYSDCECHMELDLPKCFCA